MLPHLLWGKAFSKELWSFSKLDATSVRSASGRLSAARFHFSSSVPQTDLRTSMSWGLDRHASALSVSA